MKPNTMSYLFAGVFALLLLALSSGVGGTQTVTGTNTYPNDHQAVQAAIGLAGGGGTVILNGNFNFGADGGVDILLPNVTLMGGAGGATITGMGKPNVALGFPCLINVGAGAIGCKITGLTITCTRTAGFSGGIAVSTSSGYSLENPVIIENNTITVYPPVPGQPPPVTGRGFAIWMRANGCPMKILNNALTGSYGAYVYPNNGDVLISGNTINSRVYGMYVMQNTHDCIVTDNTVNGYKEGQAMHVCTTPGYGKVVISRNRAYGARAALNIHDLGIVSQEVPADITDNHLEPTFVLPSNYPVGSVAFGLWGYFNKSPLNVVNNVVRVIADQPGDNPNIGQLGIYLYSWDPRNGMDQENGPVFIKGNDIEIRYPMPDVPDYSRQTIGMLLGDGGVGLSNVTVKQNRLTGSVMDGITRLWYGKNTVIAENDLSGLNTWEAQMWVVGGETTVKDNVLGFANHIPGYSWGVLLGSGMLPPQYNYPMPYPTQNCTFTGNDYRLTGLPGWTDENSGCIIIRSAADVGGYGTEVRNNLINENGKFPVGTGGAAKQVFELKTELGLVHDNRIVGMPAAGLVDPGIGQRLKAIRGIGGVMLAAGLEEANGEKGLKCGLEDESLGRANAEAQFAVPELVLNEPALPTRLELYGNYPNPFNPSTTIRFGLPKASYVKIEVYNALGQMVAQLVDGELPAGFHAVRFDGSSLSSGLYFYRMVTGNVVETRKMLLLK